MEWLNGVGDIIKHTDYCKNVARFINFRNKLYGENSPILPFFHKLQSFNLSTTIVLTEEKPEVLSKSKCTNVLNALHQCYKSQVGPKLVEWRNFGSESKVDLEQDLGAHLHICFAGSHMDVVYRKDPTDVEAGQWFNLSNTFSIFPPKILKSIRQGVARIQCRSTNCD